MKLKGKVVAVTGAASGIGRALGVELVRAGCEVALSDIQAEALEESGRLARAAGQGRVTTHVLDVGERDAIYAWRDEVLEAHGHCDALINNAGVAVRGTVEGISDEDFKWLLDINVWGVVHGVRAFLPELKRRPEACVVNISSINAMVPFPENGPYNMSKYAVAALSETLEMELAGTRVRVVSVHPGGVRTNIANSARNIDPRDATRFGQIARTSPTQAARIIIQGMKRNQFRVFVGADAKTMQLLKRLLPNATLKIVGAAARRVAPSTRG